MQHDTNNSCSLPTYLSPSALASISSSSNSVPTIQHIYCTRISILLTQNAPLTIYDSNSLSFLPCLSSLCHRTSFFLFFRFNLLVILHWWWSAIHRNGNQPLHASIVLHELNTQDSVYQQAQLNVYITSHHPCNQLLHSQLSSSQHQLVWVSLWCPHFIFIITATIVQDKFKTEETSHSFCAILILLK